MKDIIAFTGRAHSGKTTAAEHLVRNLKFTRLSFARPIRDMLAAIGLSEEELTIEKDQHCAKIGKTPRFAMETLGTEWGRNFMGTDFWVTVMLHRIYKTPSRVVIDDCRFDNEAEAIRRLGGFIVQLNRPGSGIASTHSSQNGVSPHLVHAQIHNDNTPNFTSEVLKYALE